MARWRRQFLPLPAAGAAGQRTGGETDVLGEERIGLLGRGDADLHVATLAPTMDARQRGRKGQGSHPEGPESSGGSAPGRLRRLVPGGGAKALGQYVQGGGLVGAHCFLPRLVLAGCAP